MAQARTKEQQAETMETFIARHEAAAQADGLVVTSITFPDAPARVYPGTYAGFPVADGKTAEAMYSDGSKHE